jgi:hypothetical protein
LGKWRVRSDPDRVGVNVWSLNHTGLKTGHYLLSEFGARFRQGIVRRSGLRLRRFAPQIRPERRRRGWFGFGGGGWEEVVVVEVDGIADAFAPAVGAESVDVFVFGEVDGLHEGLGQVGDGAGGSGLYLAADNGGDEATQGGTEIAGGEVVAGKEVGQVFAEFFGGAGAGFLLGVAEAELRVAGDAGRAATAAIREGKHTQGHAVVFRRGRGAADWTER